MRVSHQLFCCLGLHRLTFVKSVADIDFHQPVGCFRRLCLYRRLLDVFSTFFSAITTCTKAPVSRVEFCDSFPAYINAHKPSPTTTLIYTGLHITKCMCPSSVQRPIGYDSFDEFADHSKMNQQPYWFTPSLRSGSTIAICCWPEHQSLLPTSCSGS